MRAFRLILLLSLFIAGFLLPENPAYAFPGRKKAISKKKSIAPRIQGVSGKFIDVEKAPAKNPDGTSASSSSSTTSQNEGAEAGELKSTRSPSSLPSSSLLDGLGKSGGAAAKGPSIGFSKGGASAGGGGGPRASIEFDDSQAKRKPEGKDYGRGDTGGGSDNNAPPGGGGPPRKAVPLPRWWPMCIFMDPSVPGGNAIVKQMVDEAADCGVNLVVFPFYMKGNYPRDAKSLVDSSKSKCNAVDGMGKVGANRGSVVTLVNDSKPVQEMCGGNRDVTGCSELGFDPGDGIRKRMASTGSYGGVSGKGQMAGALIGPGGFSAKTVAGKALGQAMMALPPGWGGGNEVGDENEGYAAAGVGITEKGWSKYGCQKMQAASFPNTDQKWKWNPDQKDYLVKSTDENRLLDITDGKQIWKTANKPPAPPDVAGDGPKGGGGDTGGGGGSGGGNSAPPSGGGSPPASGGNGGHKLLAGGAGAGGGGGGAAGGAAGGLGMKSLRAGAGSSLRGGGTGSAPIYGGDAGESGDGGGDPSAVAAGASPGAGGVAAPGAGGASVTFDDKIQKGGIGSVTANGPGGAAGGKGPGGAAGAPGSAEPGSVTSGAGGFGGSLLAGAASSLKAIKAMQDDFFGLIDKRLQSEDEERNRKANRGESLRKAGGGASRLGDTKSKKIYQGVGGEDAVTVSAESDGLTAAAPASPSALGSSSIVRAPSSERRAPKSEPIQHPAAGGADAATARARPSAE